MEKELRLEELKEAKVKLMRMYAINPMKAYADTIRWVDKKIGRVTGVLLVLLILFIGGCQTFKGALGDTAWMLQKGADNIQMQNK